jgi:hypothetical protein
MGEAVSGEVGDSVSTVPEVLFPIVFSLFQATLNLFQATSKRSAFITFVHAATKSFTNFFLESLHA